MSRPSFDYIAQFNQLSKHSQQALLEKAKRQHYPKHHILIEAGTLSDFVYFLERGAVRNFHYDPEGRDVTTWFDFDESIIADTHRYVLGRQNIESIQVLEASTIYAIRHDELQALYARHHDICNFGRLMAEFFCLQLTERVASLQLKSAIERYEYLLTVEPRLFQRIPLIHIASFLGITRETLSRLRGQR